MKQTTSDASSATQGSEVLQLFKARPQRGRLPTNSNGDGKPNRPAEPGAPDANLLGVPPVGRDRNPTGGLGQEFNVAAHLVPDAPKDTTLIERTLRGLDFFNDLPDEAIGGLAQAMHVFSFEDGAEIATQKSTKGTHFFIIEEGVFDILKDDHPEPIAQVKRGALIGESVILLSGAQNATVRANGRCTAYGMEGLQARRVLKVTYEAGKQDVDDAVNLARKKGACLLLSSLTPYAEQALYRKATLETFASGEILQSVGQTEFSCLYIVLKGTLRLQGSQPTVNRTLESLSVVGDIGMLYNVAPSTVECTSPVQALKLTRELLDEMFGDSLRSRLINGRVTYILSQMDHFRTYDMERLDRLATQGRVMELHPGQEFEWENLTMIVSTAGDEIEAKVWEDSSDTTPKIQKLSGTLGHTLDRLPGKSMARVRIRIIGEEQGQVVVFGSEWMKYGLSRQSTVGSFNEDVGSEVGITTSVKGYVRSESLKFAVMSDDRAGALKKIVVLHSLSPELLQRLADILEVTMFKAGDIVFEQGNKGEDLYIIHKGHVEVSINGRRIRTMATGDYLGERSLLKAEPRSATVKALSESELWKMSMKNFFDIIPEPVADYMRNRIELQNTQVEIEQLHCLRVVGRGGFGVVKMVQHRVNMTRYALKCVSIRQTVERRQQEALMTEKSILAEIDHPFMIKYIRTFRGVYYVYFLMELVTGGELNDALQVLGLLDRKTAQFYVGSITLALEFLHMRRIAYLDLKGENCLIDNQGYLKIIDFGCAERAVNGKIFGTKGTYIFMAPEVMKLTKPYTTAADLWSLGVCIVDFMLGVFPYGGDIDLERTEAVEIVKKIMKEIEEEPGKIIRICKEKKFKDKAVKNLMSCLLEKDPGKRLGAGPEGYKDLKEHPFFDGLSFDDLLARQVEPPYKPKGERYAEDDELEANPGRTEMQTVVERSPEDDEWLNSNNSDSTWLNEFGNVPTPSPS